MPEGIGGKGECVSKGDEQATPDQGCITGLGRGAYGVARRARRAWLGAPL